MEGGGTCTDPETVSVRPSLPLSLRLVQLTPLLESVCVASVRRCKEFELITPLLVLLLLLLLLKLQLQLLLLLLQLMMVSLSLSLLVLHERQASPSEARRGEAARQLSVWF